MFVLNMSEVRSLKCRYPPSVTDLQQRLIDLLKQAVATKLKLIVGPRTWVDGTTKVDVKNGLNNLIEALNARLADRHWLLEWLSTLHLHGLKSPYFEKGYFSAKKSKRTVETCKKAQNHDNFFTLHQPMRKHLMNKRLNKRATLKETLRYRMEQA